MNEKDYIVAPEKQLINQRNEYRENLRDTGRCPECQYPGTYFCERCDEWFCTDHCAGHLDYITCPGCGLNRCLEMIDTQLDSLLCELTTIPGGLCFTCSAKTCFRKLEDQSNDLADKIDDSVSSGNLPISIANIMKNQLITNMNKTQSKI